MTDAAPRTAVAPPGAARKMSFGGMFLAGFWPFVVATHAGGLVWSTQGIPDRGTALAAIVFAGVFLVVALGFRFARRRARLRRIVRLTLLLYVVATTVRGYVVAGASPAGAPRVGVVTAWPAERQPFLAGVGEASFEVTEKDTLAGYGMRPRRVTLPWLAMGPLGRLSLDLMARPDAAGAPRVPLFATGTPGPHVLGARALVIRPSGTGAPLAICRLDLVMVDRRVTAGVLARVRDLGFTPDTLILAATHTHSGPGGHASTCLAQALGTDHARPDVIERIVHAATSAIRAAHGAAVPARLGFVRADDRDAAGKPLLARNRSDPDPDRLDTEVLGLRLDAADGDRRIALLLVYALHPVWGRPKNRVFDPDVAGALERLATAADGAPVVFVNGAEGDVAPRMGRGDPALPPPLASFEAAVAEGLKPRATSSTLALRAVTVRREMGSARYVESLFGPREALNDLDRRPFGRSFAEVAAEGLLVPANALLWSAGVPDVRMCGSFAGGFGAVVRLDPWLDGSDLPVGAVRLETEKGTALLAWAACEPVTAVGEAVKAAGRARGASPVYVIGLANDYLAYVAGDPEIARPTYEGRMTLFGSGTAARVVESLGAAFDAVTPPAPPR